MTYQNAVLSMFRPTEEGKKTKHSSHADKTRQQLLGVLYQLAHQRFSDNSKMLIIIYTVYNKLHGGTLHPRISPFKIPLLVHTTHPLSAHQTRFVFRNPLLSTPPHKIQLALRQRWKFLTRSLLIPRCPRTCSGCSVLLQCLPGVSTIKFRHRIFRPLTRLCHQVELLTDS